MHFELLLRFTSMDRAICSHKIIATNQSAPDRVRHDIINFISANACSLNRSLEIRTTKNVQERSRSDLIIISAPRLVRLLVTFHNFLMPSYTIYNTTRQTIVGTHLELANTAHARLADLLNHKRLEMGHGLLIPGRNWIPLMAIHTSRMKFPIDVFFLDKDNRVTWVIGAQWVLETAEGTIANSGTRQGDPIRFELRWQSRCDSRPARKLTAMRTSASKTFYFCTIVERWSQNAKANYSSSDVKPAQALTVRSSSDKAHTFSKITESRL